MDKFKRIPEIRMLAAEVRDTTIEIQSGRDKYSPTIFLSPTGAEVNRVLIAGTAIEKEDIGSENPFWRVRVADPTGAIFVYAGQYQPEAAKAIQKLEVPCFVIISGKLAHYTPEMGGDTIVSVRAESIDQVSIESRDLALADIARHTVRRIMEARRNEKVQDNYPYYDYNAFVQSISTFLDQFMEEPVMAINDPQAAPPTEPASRTVPPSIPASKPLSLQAVQARAAYEKPKEVTEEPFKESPKEAPKEAPEVELKPGGLEDSTSFVLDILRSHMQESIPRDTIQNVLRALGYAMLDVDSILAKLKSAGEIIEPRDGFFRAV